MSTDRLYMRGNKWARDAIIGYLKEAIPTSIATMKATWKDDLAIDVPKTWDSYDPFSTVHDAYPMVGVFFGSARDYRRTEVHGDGQEYESKWGTTVSVLVTSRLLGPDKDGVDRWEEPRQVVDHCENLTSAILGALLLKPSLISSLEGGEVSIDENTVEVTYNEPMAIAQGSDRRVAAASIAFTTIVLEDAFVINPTVVETYEVETRRLT